LIVIKVPGGEIFSRFRKFKMKIIHNIEQNIFKRRLKKETRALKTVPNIEIACHKEDVVYINVRHGSHQG